MIIPDHVRTRAVEMRRTLFWEFHYEDVGKFSLEQWEHFGIESLEHVAGVLDYQSAVPVDEWHQAATNMAAIHLLMVDTCSRAYEHLTGERPQWAMSVGVDWFLPSNN